MLIHILCASTDVPQTQITTASGPSIAWMKQDARITDDLSEEEKRAKFLEWIRTDSNRPIKSEDILPMLGMPV